MTLTEMFNKQKQIGFAGLGDVCGGKMWFVFNLDLGSSAHFWTKKEAYDYIRQTNFHITGYKKLLRKQLNESHGRAVKYA